MRLLSTLVALLLSSHLFAQPCAPSFHVDRLPDSLAVAPQAVKNRVCFNGSRHVLLQFSQLPDGPLRRTMEQNGVFLHHYLSCNTYTATVYEGVDFASLVGYKVSQVYTLPATSKLHENLRSEGTIPDYAYVGVDKLRIIVNLFSKADNEPARSLFLETGYQPEQTGMETAIYLTVPTTDLARLTNLPFVLFIEPMDAPPVPENQTGATLARSNAISNPLGRSYNGEGIVIGHQDDGAIENDHPDWQNRVTHAAPTSSGDHGDHIAGTLVGAGNRNPRGRGLAYGANLYYTSVYDIVNNMTNRYNIDSVLITSTSYGNGCNAGYTSFAQQHDQQVLDLPGLMHVFSGGNSGTSNCGYGAGSGWGNVTGGHKQGKNVLAVANANDEDDINFSSSRGPAHDGRIKPDITAKGTSVFSTTDLNASGYTTKTGTSMACPMIAATLAQLYQGYRDITGQQIPPSDLMKCILLNSADDVGNPGPDFEYGWGRVNALEAIELIESGNYLQDSVSNGGSVNHSLTIPAGVEQVNIMLYWHDPTASAGATTALVNNLDLTVTTPGGSTVQPWVLNPAPNASTLDDNATTGTDNLNNMEQVTINTPSAGTYTLNVSGSSVPFGPQSYYISYQFIEDDITVTYPMGGEYFEPGTTEKIRWDAFGDSGSFTVEFSDDNGATWTTLSSTVSGDRRYADWTIPNQPTSQALLRISRGGQSGTSTFPFHIMDVPTGLNLADDCLGQGLFTWNTVSGATEYVVYALGSEYMEVLDTVSTASYTITGLASGETNWYSVAAIHSNGAVSQRAIAIEYSHNGTGPCFPNDVSADNMLAPQLGNCSYSTTETLSFQVLNRGANDVTAGSSAIIGYRINGGTPTTETVTFPVTRSTSEVQDFTFTSTIDLSTAGTYVIDVWITYAPDSNAINDTLTTTLVNNPGISTFPYTEDFETWSLCGNSNVCDVSCSAATSGGWIQSNTDDQDWRIDEGATASNNTGPNQDYSPGNATGNYIYTEASGGCTNQVFSLISPCFDFTALVNPEVSFFYHMFGADIGTLSLDISTNGGSTWTTLWTQTGEVQTSSTDAWQRSLTNLAAYAGLTVQFRLRGQTGPDFASDMAVDAFTVYENNCVPLSLPFSEDFDAVSSPALPLCWTTNNIAQVYTTPSCGGSVGQSLQLEGVPGSYALTPVIDASGVSEVVIECSFRRGDGTDCGNTPEAADNIDIDYWNGTSWVRLDNYTGSTAPNSFTTLSFSLNSGLTAQFQLRFQIEGGSGAGFDNFNFDWVTVTPIVCPAPTGLTASAATANSIDLQWTDPAGASQWLVTYGPNATGVDTSVVVSSSNPTLTGLSSATIYDVFVKALCPSGDTSNASAATSFTTLGNCGYYDIILTDDLGDGWNGGELDVYLNGSLQQAGLTLSSGFGPDTFRFFTDTNDILSVVYSLGNFPDENAFSVVDESGAVVATSGAGGSTPTNIGDFTIPSGPVACESCLEPTAVSTSAVTTNSAVVAWTNGGSETEWIITYGPTGFSAGTGSTVSASSNPFTLTGLSSGTVYDVYVQALCAPSDTSALSLVHSFTTLCAPVSLPYSENFDAATTPNLPICWSTNNASVVFTTASCAGASAQSLQLNGNPSDFALTPIFDVSTAPEVTVKYAYRAGDNTCGESPDSGDVVAVQYFDGSSWITTKSYDGATAPRVFTLDSFVVTSGLTAQFQVRFFVVSGSGVAEDNFNFDDVSVTSSCPTGTTLVDTTLCASSYTLPGGNVVSTSGTYTDTLTASSGCDSLVTTNLSLGSPSFESTSADLCQGDTIVFNGNDITAGGTYTDSLTSVLGCDSIIELIVVELLPTSSSLVDSFCTGSSYTLPDGSTTSAPGTYSATLTAANGCDSVISITLTEIPLVSTSQSFTLCSGSSITINGRVVSAPGTYVDTLVSSSSCDSVVTSTVSLSSAIIDTQRVQVCFGETFTLPDGRIASSSGFYSSSFTTPAGCDSIVVTDLTVRSVANTFLTDGFCPGDSVFYDGSFITTPGTYRDTLVSSFGCDSIVTLTVTNRGLTLSSTTLEVCPGGRLPDGQVADTSGIYRYIVPSDTDCDTLVTATVTVRTFDVTTITNNGAITVFGPDSWQDVQWYNCNTGVANPADTLRFLQPASSGSYAAIISDGECTDTTDCKDVLFTSIRNNHYPWDVQIAPNPTDGDVYIRTGEYGSYSLALYDTRGRQVSHTAGQFKEYRLSVGRFAQGVYFLQLTSPLYGVYTERIVVQ